MRLRDMMVMMLGITDMEAEQVDNHCQKYMKSYADIQDFIATSSMAEVKGFITLACDEYRRANNIQTKSL